MAHSSSVFKSVCEDILEPRGVKVGGYKDGIFDSLSEKEREELSCQICFMVVKDAHTCTNKHLFCGSCIFAWSMTSEGNTDRCPVCRVRGSYSSDDILSSRINNLAANCLSCKWKGQLGDYRSHSHGLEDVGIDPKQASLPSLWSADGEAVFPDLGNSDNFEETVQSSRRRHQSQYLNTQLELIEGQARLAFLLDVFEEDLQRHRDNLSSLVRLQQRYNAEQFNEVMRLESELGQITGNLLRLIESANTDVDTLTNRLRSNGATTRTSPSRRVDQSIPRTLDRVNNHTSGVDHHLVGRSPAAEPREPVRRARFFRLNSQGTGTSLPAGSTSSTSQSTPSTDLGAGATSSATSPTLFNVLPASSSSNTQTTVSISCLPISTTTGASAGVTSERLLTRRSNYQANNDLSSSTDTSTVPIPERAAVDSVPQATPLPPVRRSLVNTNPFTITWPPVSTTSNTNPPPSGESTADASSRRVTRQQLRQNATERSMRDTGS